MKGIVTLCGSTRFKEEFMYLNAVLTKYEWTDVADGLLTLLLVTVVLVS